MVVTDPHPQAQANDELWRSKRWLRAYANRTLRPVEVVLLVDHREALSGRVLEIGCGGGRLTGYLIEIADEVQAIDVSQDMIGYCRDAFPGGEFGVGDLRDLSPFADGSRDAIVAGYCVIDVLDDEERSRALDEMRRVLTPGGTLLLSAHNLAAADRREKPTDVRWGEHPIRIAADLVRMPRRVRNSRKLTPHERREGSYAVLNDISHEFLALHYYIGRDDQERQLRAHGFELIDCRDLDGAPVSARERAEHSPELHYVARALQ